MLGIGRPRHAAVANGAKVAWLVVSIPFALTTLGLLGVLCAIALADMVRYVWLVMAHGAEGLSFKRQDMAVTLLLISMIVGWRLAFAWLGVVPGFQEWLSYADVSLS